MTIKAKFAGICKLCSGEWEKGFDIFYNREPRAICVNENCYEEQMKKSGGTQFSSFKNEIVTIKPEISDEKIKRFTASKDFLLSALSVAHDMTSELYPELDKNTNTFGQIRSKLADQLLMSYNLLHF